ncbi:DUF3106 domain-containing protein [Polaromonas naphthalenivorans]|uniref:DUF3106 domain-containing protein n=1 Tax=Polaromonas naphthalenivorans TaxID=216465 RepID=UPI001E47825B|nr:DUF3106 domain-containing protein [Polaromonas naphthalenivorans]
MTSKLQLLGSGLALAGLLAWPSAGFAQAPKPQVSASAALAGKTIASGPDWSQLTPSQQQALAPLASSWNTGMSEAQKRKWLEISKNYSALTPQDQATLNSRMNEWVALSPQQRAQARLNFGKTKELSRQLTPEEKKAKWEAYQALSPEEKQKLAAKASPRPTGAATAVKPVAPQKLASVPAQPASKPAFKPAPKIVPSFPAAVPVPATPASVPGTAPQR